MTDTFWKKDHKPQHRVDEGEDNKVLVRRGRGVGGGPPPGMNTQGKLSIAALALGVVVLVVLTTLGGVAKKSLHNSILSRLEYKLPDGYKNNPNYQECYRSTTGMFYDEYYLWNLTNPDEFLTGSTPNFNVTGPYVYTQWYCNYDHHIDEEAGLLTYRTIEEGYRFIREQSPTDDDVLITNVNPAYLGLLELAQSETGIQIVMTSGALSEIISELNSQGTILTVQLGSFAKLTQKISASLTVEITPTYAAGVLSQIPPAALFNPSFQLDGFQGWAYYTLQQNASVDVNISSASQNSIFAAWEAPNGLYTFNVTTVADIVITYSVTPEQAEWLHLYVADYLLVPATFGSGLVTQVMTSLYSQWANGTLQNSPLVPGVTWEIGVPVASGISVTNTEMLFDPTSNCSLTNLSGVELWVSALATPALINGCQFTLTPEQVELVLTWIVQFTTSVSSLALAELQLSSWDDFAYAQWGQLVTGVSFVTDGWSPEIAAFPPPPLPGFNSSCAIYTVSQAKELLNGTTGLFNYEYTVAFMQYALQEDFATIQAIWGIDSYHATCLSLYIEQVILPKAVVPVFNQAIAEGGGLVVSRTVNQWLWNATDPLLVALHQDPDVSLVGNDTVTQEEADQLNFTYVRIYTGHNDLYWSLMPFNDGEVLPFWRGDNATITGYNGTQFPPFNEINKAMPDGHPLLLFNHLINRTVPFHNVGEFNWRGVHVRYLTLTPDALTNETYNPANYPYYATYSGLVNKTSNPPYLPVFLSPVDFHLTDPSVTENITWQDLLFTDYDPDDSMSLHRLSLFVLVEPELGSSVWGQLPIQMNLKYTPTEYYPNIPYGFAPIYWNTIGNIATQHDIDEIKSDLYDNEKAWKALIGVGVGVGVICIVAGIIGVHHYTKHKNELKDSSTIDSSVSPKSSTSSVSAYTG